MNLVIEVGPVRSQIVGTLTEDENQAVTKVTSAMTPGAVYTKLFKAHRWDGKTYLFTKKQLFPTGLLDLVVEAIKSAGGSVVVNLPEIPSLWQNQDLSQPLMDQDRTVLRDYQQVAVEAYLKAGRGIIRIATGGGKTAVAASIFRAVPGRILLVLYGRTLLAETRQKLAEYLGEPVGIIAGSEFDIQRVTVASVNTMHARTAAGDPLALEVLSCAKIVACDEVHRSSATTWTDILKASPTHYKLGLSGTPLKRQELPDLRLLGWVGPLLGKVTVTDLQDAGFLSQAHLSLLVIDKPVIEGLRWPDVVKNLIEGNKKRNRLIADTVLDRARTGHKVFVLAGNSLALTHSLFKMIESEHSGTELLTGKTGSYNNVQALARFRKGISTVAVASTVIDEGIDAPSTDVVVLAFAGKSYVKTLQRIGRGLRLKKNQGELEVIDVCDYNNKILRRHSLARLNMYEQEGFFNRIEVLS